MNEGGRLILCFFVDWFLVWLLNWGGNDVEWMISNYFFDFGVGLDYWYKLIYV